VHYPLTGLGCVSRVYTDLATFAAGPAGVVVTEVFGTTRTELVARLDINVSP